MGRKCPTCGVQGTSVGGGGAKKTEPVALRPRPAGTHEEPTLASWASVPRPDAASSRGPVLPPASPTLHRSPRPGLRGFRGQQVLCSGTDTARQLLQVGTCPRCCLGRPHAGRPFTPAAKPTQVRDPQGLSLSPLGNVVHTRTQGFWEV